MRRVMPIAERETSRAPTRPLIVNFSLGRRRNFKNARSDYGSGCAVVSYRRSLYEFHKIADDILLGVKRTVEDISIILRRFVDIRESPRGRHLRFMALRV